MLSHFRKSFLRSSAPPGYVEGPGETKLLYHMDGSEGGQVLTDSSSFALAMPIMGTSATRATAGRFGGMGLDLAGGPANMAAVEQPQMQLKNEDFTIEGWIKSTGIVGSQWRVIMSVDGNNPDQYGALQLNAVGLFVSADGLSWLKSSTQGIKVGTLHDNTWRHLAIVRHGTSLRVYNQGKMEDDFNIGAASIFARSPGLVTFGTNRSVGAHACHLDEWRFSKLARYTSDFPPPTAPFSG